MKCSQFNADNPETSRFFGNYPMSLTSNRTALSSSADNLKFHGRSMSANA